MSGYALPPVFCWTKVRSEIGQEPADVILRKEWERQIGRGSFFWGISQSVANAIRVADPEVPLRVLFSPTTAKTKSLEGLPSAVLWSKWIHPESSIERDLPPHCLITSREFLSSGRVRAKHYALACFSEAPLSSQGTASLRPADLRNLLSGRPVGASQATAIVRTIESDPSSAREGIGRRAVLFQATLQGIGCVQLAGPVPISPSQQSLVRSMRQDGSAEDWYDLACSLRRPAQASVS